MHQQLCQDYAQLQVAYQAAVSKSQQTQAEVESVKAHSAELEGQLETSRFMTEAGVIVMTDMNKCHSCMHDSFENVHNSLTKALCRS